MPKIFVDADACPVKAEIERVAERHQLEAIFVSNSGHRISPGPLFRQIVVEGGPDVADDWIALHVEAGDLVITADIPLAQRCLEKGARTIAPNGKAFTATNIGMALGMRELNRHLREVTGGQTYHSGFTKQDRSRFLNVIENEIQALRRIG